MAESISKLFREKFSRESSEANLSEHQKVKARYDLLDILKTHLTNDSDVIEIRVNKEEDLPSIIEALNSPEISNFYDFDQRDEMTFGFKQKHMTLYQGTGMLG